MGAARDHRRVELLRNFPKYLFNFNLFGQLLAELIIISAVWRFSASGPPFSPLEQSKWSVCKMVS